MAWVGSPLDDVRVASPCKADWNDMYGDERRRFCGDCKLNVYNLSGMSREEAERLVTNSEGRLCVRFFRRRDGSILTADCPVGWAKVKAKTRKHLTAVFSMLATLFGGTFVASYFASESGPAIGENVGAMHAPESLRDGATIGNMVLGQLPNTDRSKKKTSARISRQRD